ncbi:MAG: hypothetical protein VX761_01210 [Planctomycetota bacterium]|nr:hypothetical protein [Planctomycetota bacterium]
MTDPNPAPQLSLKTHDGTVVELSQYWSELSAAFYFTRHMG